MADLRDAADNVREGFTRMAAAMLPAMLAVKAAFDQFGDRYYAYACWVYLRQHQRLPGSDRTARLRKKRRDAVLRWFEAEMARQRDGEP